METDSTNLAGEATHENIDMTDRSLYLNRQLSWLQFNWRVFSEAQEARLPLLERIKFLAICCSNLDEFFMIRVSGLRRQLAAGVAELSQDGMSPSEQMAAIRHELLVHVAAQANCWRDELLPKLHEADIHIFRYDMLSETQRLSLRDYFAREIFPVLTPLAFDPAHPFPHISNLSLNLAVVVQDPHQGERFARLKVPEGFPRLVPIPSEHHADEQHNGALLGATVAGYVWLEELIAANLDMLFTGVKVENAYPFRVTRDADLEIEEDEASDLLETIEESIEMRDFGSEVRLEVDTTMPARIRDLLITNLRIASYLVYAIDAPLGMADLLELTRLDRHDLKDPPFIPSGPSSLLMESDIFSAIKQQDILLYHPYHSFSPVVDFIREAAKDPNVLAIKQTLYRVGPNSPIVDALMEAREHNKQVAVLVELKARFDEENNIAWARALEQKGVHVVYGMLGLKTHAKMCLVVRREAEGIVRYVHMSTGNYNPLTSKVYSDFGFFTCDPVIGADISDLFNTLTGYSYQESYRKLLVAPGGMRKQLLALIEHEIARHREHGDGYIAFKMNSLVDPACIQALYRASQAGVKIDLQIRGICCLRPGVPGVSETITVTSIVGRFLEHARLYYFWNGGQQVLLLGSADLMPRNLDGRVEIFFPVENARLRRILIEEILAVHLRDNVQCWRMEPDGQYTRLHPKADEEPCNSQLWLLEHAHQLQ